MAQLTIARWKAEIMAGLLLLGLGLGFVLMSLRLPPPEEAGVPGPGSVPMLLGAVVAACGFILAGQALLARSGEALALAEPRQMIALAGLVLGAALFEPAGFLLATFVLLASGFVFLGGAGWRGAVPSAALVSGALWLLFTKLLGVGLPYGFIGEILFR